MDFDVSAPLPPVEVEGWDDNGPTGRSARELTREREERGRRELMEAEER